MKLKTLLEADRYFDAWAKRQAAANRAKNAPHEAEVKKQKEELKKLDAQIKAREKADREKVRKMQQEDEIWQRVQHAIGNSFPDGDPIDHLMSYMNRYDVSMEMIDKVVKKFAGRKKTGKYGFYNWLADMWDDTQADAVADAKNGHHNYGEHNPFYDIDDGKIIPLPNPWK